MIEENGNGNGTPSDDDTPSDLPAKVSTTLLLGPEALRGRDQIAGFRIDMDLEVLTRPVVRQYGVGYDKTSEGIRELGRKEEAVATKARKKAHKLIQADAEEHFEGKTPELLAAFKPFGVEIKVEINGNSRWSNSRDGGGQFVEQSESARDDFRRLYRAVAQFTRIEGKKKGKTSSEVRIEFNLDQLLKYPPEAAELLKKADEHEARAKFLDDEWKQRKKVRAAVMQQRSEEAETVVARNELSQTEAGKLLQAQLDDATVKAGEVGAAELEAVQERLEKCLMHKP